MTRRYTAVCVAVVLGGLMLRGTAAGADVPPPVQTRQSLSESIRYAGLDDPKATLDEALSQLAKTNKRLHLNFDLNENAFRDDKLVDVQKYEIANPNPLPPMDTSLDTVLRKILSRLPAKSGATYVIRRDGAIEITTQKAAREEFYRRGITGPLPSLVVAVLVDQPLDEALRILTTQTHANVVLDPRALKGMTKTSVTAELINVPLDDAVRLLADMVGMQAVYVGRVLYVTNPQNARQLLAEEDARDAKQRREAAESGAASVQPVAPNKEKAK